MRQVMVANEKYINFSKACFGETYLQICKYVGVELLSFVMSEIINFDLNPEELDCSKQFFTDVTKITPDQTGIEGEALFGTEVIRVVTEEVDGSVGALLDFDS